MQEQFQIPQKNKNIFYSISQFDIKHTIGKGGFSEVILCVLKNTQDIYAIKIIDLNILSKNDYPNLSREILIHRSTIHDNIVTLYDYFQEQNKVYLVLEYYQNGNLFQQICLKRQIPLQKIQSYLKQLINALKYLHSLNLVHRDLKPENLLLDNDMNRLSICDFGWACHIQDYSWLRIRAGTKQYMAPEVLMSQLQSQKTDIWAIGILLYEMLFFVEPFTGYDWQNMYESITKGVQFNSHIQVPQVAKDLIQYILKFDQEDRPTLQQILDHQFFKEDFDFEQINESMKSSYVSYRPQKSIQEAQTKRTLPNFKNKSNQWINTTFSKTINQSKLSYQMQYQSSQENLLQEQKNSPKPQKQIKKVSHNLNQNHGTTTNIKNSIQMQNFKSVYSKFKDNVPEKSVEKNISTQRNHHLNKDIPNQIYHPKQGYQSNQNTSPLHQDIIVNNIYSKNIIRKSIKQTPQFQNYKLKQLLSDKKYANNQSQQYKNKYSSSQDKRSIKKYHFSQRKNFNSQIKREFSGSFQTQPQKIIKYTKSFQKLQETPITNRLDQNTIFKSNQDKIQAYYPNSRDFYIKRSLRVFSKSPVKVSAFETSIFDSPKNFNQIIMQKERIFIFLLFLCNSLLSQINEVNFESCKKCECYKVQCAVIRNADIDCEDKYKQTCDRKRYYLREEQCNSICDCCLEGECKKWTNYFCFVYKTFEFFSGLFFLGTSLNILLLKIVYEHFMKIKRKFNKQFFKKKIENDLGAETKNPKKQKKLIKTYFYKFRKTFYIQREEKAQPTFLTDPRSKKVMGLFAKLEMIRPLAMKNYLTLFLMLILFNVISGIGLYTFLSLNERPYEYGIYAPILMFLFIIFYVLFFICTKKLDSYTQQVNLTLDQFEQEHKCKIRIRREKKCFEINWNPAIQTSKKSGKNSKLLGKAKSGRQLPLDKIKAEQLSFEDISVDKDNSLKKDLKVESIEESFKNSKLEFGNKKPKISKNKIVPQKKSTDQTFDNQKDISQDESKSRTISQDNSKSKSRSRSKNKVENISLLKKRNK